MYITGWVLTGFFAAVDQLIRLDRIGWSYLPKGFFTWKLRLNFMFWFPAFRHIDAWHTYQGLKMILFGLSLRATPIDVWWQIALVIYGWYELRNFFMHWALLWSYHRRFPFFRTAKGEKFSSLLPGVEGGI